MDPSRSLIFVFHRPSNLQLPACWSSSYSSTTYEACSLSLNCNSIAMQLSSLLVATLLASVSGAPLHFKSASSNKDHLDGAARPIDKLRSFVHCHLPSLRPVSKPSKEPGEKCTKIESPIGGYTLLTCPGCTKIIGQDGEELLRTGNRCDEYERASWSKQEGLQVPMPMAMAWSA